MLELCPGYMAPVLDNKHTSLKARIRPHVRRYEIDTLVGIGLSGGLIVPKLAREMGLHWAVVRKESDNSHSLFPFVGRLGKRWLFVDDIIDTGKSLAYACKRLSVDLMDMGYRYESEFVGVYLYDNEEFYDANAPFIVRCLDRGNKRLREGW